MVDATVRVCIRASAKQGHQRAQVAEAFARARYRFVAVAYPREGENRFCFICRTSELDRLRDNVEIADSGKRQVACTSGDVGCRQLLMGRSQVAGCLPLEESNGNRVVTGLRRRMQHIDPCSHMSFFLVSFSIQPSH